MGCGGDSKSDGQYDETTLSIDKKGRVSETIVESFDKDYYDVAELTSEFDKLIDDYNSEHEGKPVTHKEIKLENGKVFVPLEFASVSDYVGLLNEDLFYGTISDAYDCGYKMDVTMKGVKEGNKIGKVEIMGMKDKQIVILGGRVRLKLSVPIAYVSASVEVLSDKEVRTTSETGGLAYIILEK